MPSSAPLSPDHIEVRGAHVHNLKNIDVDVPLGCIVGIAGSGKAVTATVREAGVSTATSAADALFADGAIRLVTSRIHTVKPFDVAFPKGHLTAVAGKSGSGKTTLVLESLVAALDALVKGQKLPSHVNEIHADGINQVKLIDATPIGQNVRSTVATYADIHDELR